jgi:hypothetical protein
MTFLKTESNFVYEIYNLWIAGNLKTIITNPAPFYPLANQMKKGSGSVPAAEKKAEKYPVGEQDKTENYRNECNREDIFLDEIK